MKVASWGELSFPCGTLEGLEKVGQQAFHLRWEAIRRGVEGENTIKSALSADDSDLSMGHWSEGALEAGESKEAAKENQVGHGAGRQRQWREEADKREASWRRCSCLCLDWMWRWG